MSFETPPPPPLPRTTSVDSPSPEIVDDALAALLQIRHGMLSSSLELIEASICVHKDSPHLHALEALNRKIDFETSEQTDVQLSLLDSAVQSIEFAREKLPNSLYFAMLQVDILYRKAQLTQVGWDLVTRLCKDALAIDNPTDPGVDMFLRDYEMQNSSKESRIIDVKKQIGRYLHACYHRSKFDVAEMESESRREQLKAALGDWIVKNTASHFPIVKGLDEEKIMLRELLSNLLTDKKKKKFTTATLNDLRKHYDVDVLHREFFEAIDLAKQYNTWKCMECFCGVKFGDPNLYRQHFSESHSSILTLYQKYVDVFKNLTAAYLRDERQTMNSDMKTLLIFDPLTSECDVVCDNELGPGRYLDCFKSDDLVFEMRDRVVFNKHYSGLLVYFNATDTFADADNASATPFSRSVGEDVMSPESDDFLSWVSDGMIVRDFMTCRSLKKSQKYLAREVYQKLEAECSYFEQICNAHDMSKLLGKIKIIESVERAIKEENEVMENILPLVLENCVNFLRARNEYLRGKDDNDSLMEFGIISNVLRAIERGSARSNQSDPEEYSTVYEYRSQEELPCIIQPENSLQYALHIVRQQIIFENAVVFKSARHIQEYETILENISSYDYRSLVVPYLKLFFEFCFEPLLSKYEVDMLSKELTTVKVKGEGSIDKGNKKKKKKAKSLN